MRLMKKFGSSAPGGRITAPPLTDRMREPANKLDLTFVSLSAKNVPKDKREKGKEAGEQMFQGVMKLLRENFPPTEYETEDVYRNYFYDDGADEWNVDVALDRSKKVVGAVLYNYMDKLGIAPLNIIVVDKGYRRQNLATALIDQTLEKLERVSRERAMPPAEYMIIEIERPDSTLDGEEGLMANVIRPKFHDKTTKAKAIRLPDGEPLEYILPVMAPDSERIAAKEAGEPLEPEPLMFCLRTLKDPGMESISSKEVASLLLKWYKQYLEATVPTIKPDEVNEQCAATLSKLIPDSEPNEIRRFLEADWQNLIVDMVPETELSFMRIQDTVG